MPTDFDTEMSVQAIRIQRYRVMVLGLYAVVPDPEDFLEFFSKKLAGDRAKGDERVKLPLDEQIAAAQSLSAIARSRVVDLEGKLARKKRKSSADAPTSSSSSDVGRAKVTPDRSSPPSLEPCRESPAHKRHRTEHNEPNADDAVPRPVEQEGELSDAPKPARQASVPVDADSGKTTVDESAVLEKRQSDGVAARTGSSTVSAPAADDIDRAQGEQSAAVNSGSQTASNGDRKDGSDEGESDTDNHDSGTSGENKENVDESLLNDDSIDHALSSMTVDKVKGPADADEVAVQAESVAMDEEREEEEPQVLSPFMAAVEAGDRHHFHILGGEPYCPLSGEYNMVGSLVQLPRLADQMSLQSMKILLNEVSRAECNADLARVFRNAMYLHLGCVIDQFEKVVSSSSDASAVKHAKECLKAVAASGRGSTSPRLRRTTRRLFQLAKATSIYLLAFPKLSTSQLGKMSQQRFDELLAAFSRHGESFRKHYPVNVKLRNAQERIALSFSDEGRLQLRKIKPATGAFQLAKK